MTGPTIADALTRIADIAETVGWQANVGASETAGQILSYLSAHPEYIEPLLRDGIFALPDVFWEHGRLTWRGANGRIVKPEFVPQQHVIDALLTARGEA